MYLWFSSETETMRGRRTSLSLPMFLIFLIKAFLAPSVVNGLLSPSLIRPSPPSINCRAPLYVKRSSSIPIIKVPALERNASLRLSTTASLATPKNESTPTLNALQSSIVRVSSLSNPFSFSSLIQTPTL